jgi:hypothetical protein
LIGNKAHVRQVRPRPVDIAAVDVWGQAVPTIAVGLMAHHRSIGEQKASVERDPRGSVQRRPLCWSRCGPAHDDQKRDSRP